MKGYWIAHYDPTDEHRFMLYREAALDSIDRLGGRILIRTSEHTAISGALKRRTLVVEFDSYAEARDLWEAPEHAAARAILEEFCQYDMIIVPGEQIASRPVGEDATEPSCAPSH